MEECSMVKARAKRWIYLEGVMNLDTFLLLNLYIHAYLFHSI